MAYQEGRNARINGQSRDSNPYVGSPAPHRMWDEGWRDSDTILKAMEPFQWNGPEPMMKGPVQLWRVDVAGYSVNVRGEEAYRHLEHVNRQLGKMRLALHKIASCASYHPGDCPDIAQKAISSDD